MRLGAFSLVTVLVGGFVLAAALGVAAFAVPVAPAKSEAPVDLSVLPLPKSVIGSVAKSLPLQPDSGVASNKDPARRGALLMPTRSTLQPATVPWKKLARISGYALDYGLGASGGAGVTEVYTASMSTSRGRAPGTASLPGSRLTAWS